MDRKLKIEKTIGDYENKNMEKTIDRSVFCHLSFVI